MALAVLIPLVFQACSDTIYMCGDMTLGDRGTVPLGLAGSVPCAWGRDGHLGVGRARRALLVDDNGK